MRRIFALLTTFRPLGYMGALLMILLAVLLMTAGDALAQQTIRVSVDSSGNQGDGDSESPSISSDGRYVAFESWASNLVAGDTNIVKDIFFHDTVTGETSRVSVDSSGNQGDRWSWYPSISSDGRYVAFHSSATNLVAGDTNGAWDVFVHDTVTGETTRVSVDSSGKQGDGVSYNPSISSDGRFVAFRSYATNLVAGDTNGAWDVFVHDTVTGETSRVSVDSSGNQGDGHSASTSISSDGRYVAFDSEASNLVAGDTNGAADIFVHDTVTGVTSRVSVDSSGNQGDGSSWDPSISSDGRYVAFQSLATNLVAGDTNGVYDVFVHDTVTGVTSRVSVKSSGKQGNSVSYSPSISSDGRYVAFQSYASNLVAGDTNGAYDVFVHDTVTGETSRVSVDSSGNQGNHYSWSPSISSDGRYVAFDSEASNLVAGDTNGAYDVFVHDRQGVTVLVPNGGEVIPSGSPYTIEWEAPLGTVSFKLRYSMDNGTTWKPIDSGITETSYDWPVPTPRKNKKKCLVKVIGYDGSDAKVGADKSDSTFTIEVVKVTYPNGGELLTSGDMPTITWTTNETKNAVEKVVLKYTKNGGRTWKKITAIEGDNPGTHSWTVPDVPETKSKCKVKVVLKDAAGNTVGKDTSDGYFTIQP
jgi:Tol biopolymer transport system component